MVMISAESGGDRRARGFMIESKYLKDNIENIQKLMAIPALRDFETKSLGKLLKLSKIREYEDGETIIREGDFDPWLYFLLSGKIRISKESLEIGIIDKKGEIFGEMRIVDSMDRSATVKAVGKTICLAVDSAAASRLTPNTPQDEKLDFLLLLYRIFAEYMSIRLRATNDELIAAKKKVKRLISKL
jgi:CRP-like cAMP-binding protein